MGSYRSEQFLDSNLQSLIASAKQRAEAEAALKKKKKKKQPAHNLPKPGWWEKIKKPELVSKYLRISPA
jgi:hypothetical protein